MLLRVDGDGVANRCRGEKLRCWKRRDGGSFSSPLVVARRGADLAVMVVERGGRGNGVRWWREDARWLVQWCGGGCVDVSAGAPWWQVCRGAAA